MDDERADDPAGLEGQLRELTALVRAQHDEIGALRARVIELERAPQGPQVEAPTGDHGTTADDDHPRTADGRRLNRRDVLRRAGITTAGAVAGGVALSSLTADPAAAATLTGSGNPGIEATGIGGHGVHATTNTQGRAAVFGTAGALDATAGVEGRANANGTGVSGFSETGAGVSASSDSGPCVYATSGSEVGQAYYGKGPTGLELNVTERHFRLTSQLGINPPVTATIPYQSGDVVYDKNHDLWLCVTNGTPGKWRLIAGQQTPGGMRALSFPNRVYDSRAGLNPTGVQKGKIGSGQERDVDLTLGGVVPSDARSVMVNLTVVNTSATGFLGLFGPTVLGWPGNSSVNWFVAGSVVANTNLVAPTNGVIRVHCNTNSSTDFLIDVMGYAR